MNFPITKVKNTFNSNLRSLLCDTEEKPILNAVLRVVLLAAAHQAHAGYASDTGCDLRQTILHGGAICPLRQVHPL